MLISLSLSRSLFFALGLLTALLPLTMHASSTWETVGTGGLLQFFIGDISLDVHPDTGLPYIGFKDADNNDELTVVRYTGTGFVTVGSPAFTPDEVGYHSLAFNPVTKLPYVAFGDPVAGGNASVMRYTGTGWISVGSPGFSSGATVALDFAFASDGTPYIAFQNSDEGDQVGVMRYTGTGWLSVGSYTVTPAVNGSLALGIQPASDTLYLAYNDSTDGDAPVVVRYNGISWVNVGSFDEVDGFDFSFAFHSENYTPYLTFSSSLDGIVVKRLDGSSWVDVGDSPADRSDSILAFDADNTPYVIGVDGGPHSLSVYRYDEDEWNVVGTEDFAVSTQRSKLALSGSTVYVAFADVNDEVTLMRYEDPPPSTPSSFAASVSADDVTLTWVNPADADLENVVIIRSTTAYPVAENDGTLVYRGSSTTYTDSNLSNATYYYSIFAVDDVEQISEPANASAQVALPSNSQAEGGSGGGGGGRRGRGNPTASSLNMQPASAQKKKILESPFISLLQQRTCSRVQRLSRGNQLIFTRINDRLQKRWGFQCDVVR